MTSPGRSVRGQEYRLGSLLAERDGLSTLLDLHGAAHLIRDLQSALHKLGARNHVAAISRAAAVGLL